MPDSASEHQFDSIQKTFKVSQHCNYNFIKEKMNLTSKLIIFKNELLITDFDVIIHCHFVHLVINAGVGEHFEKVLQ